MTLYEKHISPKGKTTYREHTGYAPLPDDELTDAQLITLAVSIGVTCLEMLHRTLPAHSRNARKTRALEAAIFATAQGHGEHVDREMVTWWIDRWNATMRMVSGAKT
jgi:hypothetical protein